MCVPYIYGLTHVAQILLYKGSMHDTGAFCSAVAAYVLRTPLPALQSSATLAFTIAVDDGDNGVEGRSKWYMN